VVVDAHTRLGDDFDRTPLEREDGLAAVRPHLRRADDDRQRVLFHDLAQEGEAVHARHDDVEDDDVGSDLPHELDGLVRVGREPDDVDARLSGEEAVEGEPNGLGVVDDQDADVAGCGHRLSR